MTPPPPGRLRRACTLLAWFFFIGTGVQLLGVLIAKGLDPTGVLALYSAELGSRSWSIVGLTYDGAPGLALAMLEAAALSGGLLATTHSRLRGSNRHRRAGHLLLVGWAALWLAGMFGLADVLETGTAVGRAGMMTVLFLAVTGRAAGDWFLPRSQRPQRPLSEWDLLFTGGDDDDAAETDAEPPLLAADVRASSRLVELDLDTSQPKAHAQPSSTPAPALRARLGQPLREAREHWSKHQPKVQAAGREVVDHLRGAGDAIRRGVAGLRSGS